MFEELLGLHVGDLGLLQTQKGLLEQKYLYTDIMWQVMWPVHSQHFSFSFFIFLDKEFSFHF